MNGTVYELYSPNCELRYIGSTKKCLKTRLSAHKSKRHPIFQHSDVNIRALEENVPADKLKKKEGEYIRRAQGKLFNTRIAGRTQRERYYEDLDASREHQRNMYTPKRNGGSGDYRQLNRYKNNRLQILRTLCIKNAQKHLRLPAKRSIEKHKITDEEIADLKKYISKAKDDESRTSQD